MATSPINLQQLREMLREFSNTDDELKEKFAMATDPAYWLELFPECAIEGPADTVFLWEAPGETTDAHIEGAVTSYDKQGWMRLPGALSTTQLEKMRRCAEVVRGAGWPPVFSYVYDDFWALGRSLPIRKLLTRMLGADFVALPRMWTHFVYPAEGNAGWSPHIDDAGATHIVSLWIPLSEATLSNGCMYVVRRNEATGEVSDKYTDTANFSARQVDALLQSVRALPASPGDVLCWSEHVIHWGSMAEPAEGIQPRVSIALEFSTPEFPTSADTPFVLPIDGPLPGFRARLESISRAILNYRRFEVLIERFAPLAEMIVGRAGEEKLGSGGAGLACVLDH
jgi:Phytanoyl-CoA dioxygenase (PhyH)